MAGAEAPARASILVVGGGRMGRIRCAHVTRSTATDLAGFVDVDPLSAAQFARDFNCDPYVSLDDALDAHEECEAVWICTPTPHHAGLIARAAERGVHIAVEKPVAMTVADITACYSKCASHGVHLHCAFQRRSDSAYRRLASEVGNGAVGAPRSIRTVFRDHPTPEKAFLLNGGGDPFHDLATHDLDFALSLVGGAIPDEVYAVGSSFDDDLRSAGVMDAATIVLRWGSQTVATLEVARASAYGYDQRCEVYGTNGAVLKVENVPDVNLTQLSEAGLNQGKLVDSFPRRFDDAFAVELDHFVDCIRGTTAPRVTARDAALATYIAETALNSATRQCAIKLDPIAVEADITAAGLSPLLELSPDAEPLAASA